MLACRCGFTCGTSSALEKHLWKFEDEPGRHGSSLGRERLEELRHKLSALDMDGDHRLDVKEVTAMLLKGDPTLKSGELELLFGSKDESKSVTLSEFFASVFGPGGGPLLRRREAKAAPPGGRGALGRAGDMVVGQVVGQRAAAPKPAPKPSVAAGLVRAELGPGPASAAPGPGCVGHAGHFGRVRVLLIRHAQSANKVKSSDGGGKSQDPDLSELGYEQASALGEHLERLFKDAPAGSVTVASSPMRRCIMTIMPAVRRLQSQSKVGRLLCHGGLYEFGCAGVEHNASKLQDSVVQEYPGFEPVCFREDGRWDYRGTNPKETEDEARDRGERIVRWIWEMATKCAHADGKQGPPGTLVLSMHQTIYDLVCTLLVDGSPSSRWEYGEIKHRLQNTGVSEVFLEGGRCASFGFVNDTSHLRPGAGRPHR